VCKVRKQGGCKKGEIGEGILAALACNGLQGPAVRGRLPAHLLGQAVHELLIWVCRRQWQQVTAGRGHSSKGDPTPAAAAGRTGVAPCACGASSEEDVMKGAGSSGRDVSDPRRKVPLPE
jgi:hypothetical protein